MKSIIIQSNWKESHYLIELKGLSREWIIQTHLEKLVLFQLTGCRRCHVVSKSEPLGDLKVLHFLECPFLEPSPEPRSLRHMACSSGRKPRCSGDSLCWTPRRPPQMPVVWASHLQAPTLTTCRLHLALSWNESWGMLGVAVCIFMWEECK